MEKICRIAEAERIAMKNYKKIKSDFAIFLIRADDFIPRATLR